MTIGSWRSAPASAAHAAACGADQPRRLDRACGDDDAVGADAVDAPAGAVAIEAFDAVGEPQRRAVPFEPGERRRGEEAAEADAWQ